MSEKKPWEKDWSGGSPKKGSEQPKPWEMDWSPKAKPAQDTSGDLGQSILHGVTLGAAPFAGGIGGAIGEVIGSTDEKAGLWDKIQKGFSEGRGRVIQEEKDIAERSPGSAIAGQIIGAGLTAPLAVVKGATLGARALGAGRVGATLGATHALGHAESGKEAAADIGLGALTNSALQVGGEGAQKVLKAAGRGMKKLASTVTKVSEQDISTYANRANEVKQMIKESGGNISEAADTARQTIQNQIQGTRRSLNKQIGDALDNPVYQQVRFKPEKLLGSLQSSLDDMTKSPADMATKARDIAEVKEMMDVVSKSLDQDGRLGIKGLQSVKQYFDDIAKPSFQNGQAIFPKGNFATRAAKAVSSEARGFLSQTSPEIKKANTLLAKLHNIEDNMNKNLIRAGRPEAALLAAGSGGNERNLNTLKALDRITGGSSERLAQNLSAAKVFANPDLTNLETTGKAAVRAAIGGTAGYYGGGLLGLDGGEAAAAGALLSNPMALRTALDVGRLGSRVLPYTGIPQTIRAASSPEAAATLRTLGTSAMHRRLEKMKGK